MCVVAARASLPLNDILYRPFYRRFIPVTRSQHWKSEAVMATFRSFHCMQLTRTIVIPTQATMTPSRHPGWRTQRRQHTHGATATTTTLAAPIQPYDTSGMPLMIIRFIIASDMRFRAP